MTDADAHAEEDRRLREQAEAKNKAEQLLYATDKNLKELGDKLPSADKLVAENAMTEMRAALESNDTARIETAYTALEQASYKLSQLLYEQVSQAQAGPQPEGGTSSRGRGSRWNEDEEVIDAEFKAYRG